MIREINNALSSNIFKNNYTVKIYVNILICWEDTPSYCFHYHTWWDQILENQENPSQTLLGTGIFTYLYHKESTIHDHSCR